MIKPSSRISCDIAPNDELFLVNNIVYMQATFDDLEIKEASNILRCVQNAQKAQLDGKAKGDVKYH